MCRVFKGGKVTVPKRLRELFEMEDGDYVKLVFSQQKVIDFFQSSLVDPEFFR